MNKNAMNKKMQDQQQKNAQGIELETTNVQKNSNAEKPPSAQSHDSQKKPRLL